MKMDFTLKRIKRLIMIDRKDIKRCPVCKSTNIEHRLGDHVSELRGTVHNIPQTICHDCGEIFLGPDSLEIIRFYESQGTKRVSSVTH